MALQPVFKRSYMEYLKTHIRPEEYNGDHFNYDRSQIVRLYGIQQPEDLLKKLIPTPEGDLQTAIAIFESYKNITPLFAQQEDLWVYLTHVDLFDYVKKRWSDTKGMEKEDAINHIKTHWFRTESVRSTISGLWWSVYFTYDEERENKYELTEILFKNETFRSRVFGNSLIIRHKSAAQGILEFMLENKEKFVGLEYKGREIAKHFNSLGGYKVLTVMDKDFFKEEMRKLTTDW